MLAALACIVDIVKQVINLVSKFFGVGARREDPHPDFKYLWTVKQHHTYHQRNARAQLNHHNTVGAVDHGLRKLIDVLVRTRRELDLLCLGVVANRRRDLHDRLSVTASTDEETHTSFLIFDRSCVNISWTSALSVS